MAPGGSAVDVRVHDRGLCESERVGEGTRVWAFAHVMAGAVVGRDCNIGGGAFVESGAVLGDRVTVKNNVLVWDRVTVEDDVFLGPAVVFTNDLRPRAHVARSSQTAVYADWPQFPPLTLSDRDCRRVCDARHPSSR